VHVDFVFPLSSHSPVSRRDRAAASSVNRLSVFREPLADLAETCGELRIDFAVGVGTDVHQQIGVVSGGADDAALDFSGAFVVAVSDVESPVVVQRVGHFERKFRADVVGVESGGVLAGEVMLEGLHVFTGAGRLVMIGNDQRCRLKFVDQCVGFFEVPVGVGLVPHAVEPDAADRAVIRQKLRELAIHIVVEISVEVAVVGASVGPVGGAARIIIGIVPVELGVIEEELHALAMAFVGEHFERIFLVRRARDDIPVGHFRVEHREAVVVARGDSDVFHSGGFGQGNPFVGIELFGIEEHREAIVLFQRDLAVVEHPFAVAENAVHAPMDEHAESHVLEVAAGLKILRRRLISGLSC